MNGWASRLIRMTEDWRAINPRKLAVRAGITVTFVDGDVYDAVDLLGVHRFDLVYTGIGAICWLPSIRRWAEVAAGLLRPGGRLFMREGHPVLWSMSDPRPDGLLVVEHPYFEAMVASPDFRGEFVLAEGCDPLPLSYTMQAIYDPDKN
jgi:SAM-dependent methyltransferase